MKYRNTKTGAIIDVAFAVNGDNWEPVGDTKKKAEEKVDDVSIENTKGEQEQPEELPVVETIEEEAKPKKKPRKGSKKK